MIKTQQELDKEINLLQERLEELKNIKIEEKKNNKRVAKGYAYYNVDSYGNVEKLNDRYDEGDNFRFYSGNYHFTEEEAEKALEKQLAFNRIMKYIYTITIYTSNLIGITTLIENGLLSKDILAIFQIVVKVISKLFVLILRTMV